MRVLLMMALFLAKSVYGATSGRLSTGLDIAQSDLEHRSRWQISFDSVISETDFDGALSLVAKRDLDGSGDGDLQLHQFYLNRPLGNGRMVTAGRISRADALGFYTLDGLVGRIDYQAARVELYGGVPRRLEDDAEVSGDALYGLQCSLAAELDAYRLSRWQFDQIDMSAGWQRVSNDGHDSLLNWRASAQAQAVDETSGLLNLSLSGLYSFSDRSLQSFELDGWADLARGTRLRLALERFDAGQTALTFRERFHALYSQGRQTTLLASLGWNRHRSRRWLATARRVARGGGDPGSGASLALTDQTRPGLKLEAKGDLLHLGDEYSMALFLAASRSISSHDVVGIDIALQKEVTRLAGPNRLRAFAFHFDHGVEARLYLTGSASYIRQSLTHEYRLNVALNYYFDGRLKESRP